MGSIIKKERSEGEREDEKKKTESLWPLEKVTLFTIAMGSDFYELLVVFRSVRARSLCLCLCHSPKWGWIYECANTIRFFFVIFILFGESVNASEKETDDFVFHETKGKSERKTTKPFFFLITSDAPVDISEPSK